MSERNAWKSAVVAGALICITSVLWQANAARVRPRPSGVDLSAIDRNVRPGDDFDAYASGNWRRRVSIPADKSEVGTVETATDRAQGQVRSLLERDAVAPATGTARLIGNLYAAFMDEARAERLDDRPLQSEIARILAIRDKEGMAEYFGATESGLGKGFFNADFGIDFKDTTRNVVKLFQDGLGMGYREAYVEPSAERQKAEYRNYIERSLILINWPDPKGMAGRIVQMESAIAQASWSTAQSSDRVKRYNPMRTTELNALAPGFPWRAYLKGAGLDHVQTIVVQQKSAFPGIAAVFADTPLDTLKAWEAFQLVDQASPYLSSRFVRNRFTFRGQVEEGMKQDAPRWRHGVRALNNLLPEAVGREYVRLFLPIQTKSAVEGMAVHFRESMKRRIERLDWMGGSTKAVAQEKLRRLKIVIGYPESLRDYSALSMARDDLLGDVRRAKAFNWAAEVASLDQPVDRNRWFLPPQVVDGFSDPDRVMMAVTAGLLQPPFYEPGADPAVNYGTVGEALGHEMTHQFDDQGRKFDPSGALNDWWQSGDAARYEREAAKLVAQFNAIEPLPGLHLNGTQTLSENIADLGGLLLALDAYHLSLGGKPAPVIDGLTGDQRVFLGWARVFRAKETEQSLRSEILSGSHTPFRFRALMPMRNIDSWYSAFHVVPGNHYFVRPEDRVRIW